jgi:hypothetical protein
MEKQKREPRTALDQERSIPQKTPKQRALTTKMGKAGRKRITDWPTISKAEIRGAQNPKERIRARRRSIFPWRPKPFR